MTGPVDPRRLIETVEAGERQDAGAEEATVDGLGVAPAVINAAAVLGRTAEPAADGTGDLAARRARRQWPLPKQADPHAPLLVVEGLRTYFSLDSGTVHAVDGVSFRLNDGEALGIAGESGCGKTTTALSLVKLLPANATIVEGTVRLFGIDLVPKSENAMRRYRWREIAIVFQGAMNALNPVRRIRDQIAEPLTERLSMPGREARRKAGDLLELVGIPRARGRAYPHELSGGMRQRAMIAMALACDPAVIIGDEPTTALDVMVQAQILELLEDLRRKLGLSLILITHDLSVIAETCDRVMVMYAGRVAEEGPVSEVFRRPRHPYTAKLLGAFPNIHADRRTLDVIAGQPPDLRDPPSGCRFHPRCPMARDICRDVVPPEIGFGDEVRVACHLWPAGSDGVTPAWSTPSRTEVEVGADAAASTVPVGTEHPGVPPS
jgi:oligopeptide/dipeptide ABC transporter ATP-binding protein